MPESNQVIDWRSESVNPDSCIFKTVSEKNVHSGKSRVHKMPESNQVIDWRSESVNPDSCIFKTVSEKNVHSGKSRVHKMPESNEVIDWSSGEWRTKSGPFAGHFRFRTVCMRREVDVSQFE
jgi:hypothetical protein